MDRGGWGSARGDLRGVRGGADVRIAFDDEETFQVDAELEAMLLESIAQGRAGNTISADDLLEEMRGRE
jgi:hypothetical protein